MWNMTFQAPQFLDGVRHKGGDLIVAAAVKGADLTIYENRCEVEGRERQHDCMFFVWSFRGRSYAAPPSLPARNVRPRVQEPSSALAEPSRGAAEPSSSATRHTEDREEAPTLEADETSSRSSADWGGAAQEAEAMLEDAGEPEVEVKDSTAGLAQEADTEAPGDGETGKDLDELAAIGFAFAKSAALLPEFETHAKSGKWIDAA